MASSLAFDLTLPELERVLIDSTDAALVVVDMQNEYMEPEGKRYMRDRAERIKANVGPLVRRFRDAGGNVVYVQSVREPSHYEFSVFGRDLALIQGTWAAEMADAVKPEPGDAIVPKHSNDAWNHTPMEETVHALGLEAGRSRVIVTGCATDGCVGFAVVGFSVRSYDVYVPVDCTASLSEADEMRGYSHYFGLGYSHNVRPTRSDLIELK